MIYYIQHEGIQEGIGAFDRIFPFSSKTKALKAFKELKLEWCDSSDSTFMYLYQAEFQPELRTRRALAFVCLNRGNWFKESSRVELGEFQSGMVGHCGVRGCLHCKKRKALEKINAEYAKPPEPEEPPEPPAPEAWGSWRTIE